MLTTDRMAQVDRNAAAVGVPRAKLMESSGNAVAQVIRGRTEPGDRVTLLCGRGNNGGDAFAAARFLSDRKPHVVLAGRPETIRTGIARENWDALVASEVTHTVCRDTAALPPEHPTLAEADLLVDALLGTGVRGALREPERTLVERVNAAESPVLACDTPSGLDANTGKPTGERAVTAEAVVTFHDRKPGLADRAEQGAFELFVADIGIPAAAERFVGPGDLRPLTRASDAHKGDHGEVLVIGGGPYTGAPALAAQAAMRAGADLVRVAAPATVAPQIQGYEEGLIVRELDGTRFDTAHLPRVRELADEHDTVVVGPGLGDAPETREAVESLLVEYAGRVVVDADALDALPAESPATVLLTPHAGEFERVTGRSVADADRAERIAAVESFAAESPLDVTVLLKGAHDVIGDGETTRVNRTGTPAMAVGGTGDVLAGVTGAVAARLAPVQAAAVAAYATGVAGERATRGDNGLVARDLLGELPGALTDDGSDRI